MNVSENVYLSFHLKIPSNGVSMTHSSNFTRDCSLIQSAVTLFKLCFKVALLQQNCYRTKLQILTHTFPHFLISSLKNVFFFWRKSTRNCELKTKKKGEKTTKHSDLNKYTARKDENVLLLNNDHDKKTYTNTKQGQTSLKNASLANK